METWNGKIRLSFQMEAEEKRKKLKAKFKEALMGLRIKEEENIVSDVIFV